MYLRPIGKYILYAYVSTVYCRLDALLFPEHGETKGFLRPDSEYTVYLSSSFPFSRVWTQILSHNWLTFLCICVQLVSIFYTRMFLLFIVDWTHFCSLSMVKPRAFCVQTVSIQYTCQNSFPFSQVWTQLFLDTTLSCSQVPSDLKPRNPYYLCASAYYQLLVIYVVSAIWHGCYDIQNTLLGIFSIFLSSREDANVLLFLLLQLNSTSTNIRNGCPYA